MVTYTIKSGDTLSKIASQYGTTVGALVQSNGIADANKINAGQVLNIGGASAPTTPLSTPKPSLSLSPLPSTYDTNTYRTQVSTLTANSTPAYIPPKTNLTYATPAPVAPTPVTPVVQKTTTPTPTTSTPSATPASGGSIVNLLTSKGIDSSFANRAKLALANGIQNYTGTASQNNALYGIIAGQGGGSTTPAGGANNNPAGGNMGGNTAVPLTPDQQRVKDNNDLATKAGEAGLSVAEYQTLMTQQNTPTKEETDRIAKELGIPVLEGQAFAKPSQSSQEMYQQAYDTAGLADLKTKIQALNDSINKDRSDLTDAVGAIDENPFLTEASRVGRGKRALDQAESRINNKLAQVDQLQKVYDGGVTEINSMVTRNTTDFGVNQQRDQAQLAYLQAKAEKEATQLTTSRSSASTSAFLTGKAGAKAPDVIGNENTGFFKWDATLKKFVQVIAPSAKAGLDIENQKLQNAKLKQDISNGGDGSGSTFKPTADQKALANRATFANMNDTDGSPITFTPADRAKLATDPNFFYWVLQKANENGIY